MAIGVRHTALALAALMVASATNELRADDNRLYRSAYFLGRGDTGISVADDEEAIFYNPAGLALGKGIYKKTVLASPQIEVSRATRDIARQLGAENADAVDTVRDHIGDPIHFGLQNFTGLILRRVALGAFVSSGVSMLAYKSKDAGALETVEIGAVANGGATFSLAESFFSPSLMFGVTAKYLQRGKGYASASTAEIDEVKEKFDDTSSFIGMGAGGGADVGMMWQRGGQLNPSFGMTLSDVGNTKITPTDDTDLDLDVKQTLNLGVALEPGTKWSKLRLLADYRDALGAVESNPRKRIHLGGELTVRDFIGFTLGLNQGYPGGGVYMDLYVVRLDFGVYTEEIGERVGSRPDTRYVMRIKAGF